MSEEIQKKQQAPETPESAAEIKKLFQNEFASGVNKIYVNSLGREVGFKEVTVLQQKTLSRIMIGNERRKDVIFDAQCAIINESALEEGFNIYRLTEFDRLKLLIGLYQQNMAADEGSFTCSECGAETKYKMNFDAVLARLDEIGIEPKKFEYENRQFKFDFTIAYPNVRLVSNFYKYYCAKHRPASKRDAKTDDSMSNMEYINLFIQKLDLRGKDGRLIKQVDFSVYNPQEIDEILQTFPQDVLYTERGVLQFITKEYLQKINDSFEKHVCAMCGTVQDEGANQAEGFL